MTASTVLLDRHSPTDNAGRVWYDVLVDGVPSPNTWKTMPAASPRARFPGVGAAAGTWYHLRPRRTCRDFSGNVSAVSNTVTVTTESSSDVVAPSTPTLTSADIGAAGYCPDEIWVTWTPSTDAVVEYEVRVNGTIIDVARWITYTDVHGPSP